MNRTALLLITLGTLIISVAACTQKELPKDSQKPAQSVKLLEIPAEYQGSEAHFSSDGRSCAVIKGHNSSFSVLLNTNKKMVYSAAANFIFSRFSDDFVFIASESGKQFAVTKQGNGAPYQSIGNPSFANDGALIYPARRDDGKWFIVSGKNVSSSFDAVNPELYTAPDGKRIMYVEQTADKKVRLKLCTSDVKSCSDGKSYEVIRKVVISRSSSTAVYSAVDAGQHIAVSVDLSGNAIREKESGRYDSIIHAGISPDGKQTAFVARKGMKSVLVKNGAEFPADVCNRIFELVVTDKGAAYYSGMVNDKVYAFYDGKKVSAGYNGIHSIVASPDGNTIVYAAENGNDISTLVINGTETAVFDRIVTPSFSPDGSKILFRARSKGERFVAVADLQGKIIREQPHYEAVWDVTFLNNGASVGYGVKQGNELWWKVEKL